MWLCVLMRGKSSTLPQLFKRSKTARSEVGNVRIEMAKPYHALDF